MPVQRAVTNAYYSEGEVSSITINNAGSGYTSNDDVTLSVSGQFLGKTGNSIANLVPVFNTSGEFIEVKIKDPGANYKTATITINDGGGTGTSLLNSISNVRIFNTGTGYTTAVISNTTATISTSGLVQPTSNAFANLIFSSNALVDIVITNKGTGYTTGARANTTISISTTGNSQPTSNATANLFFTSSAVLTPVIRNGAIHSVLIEDEGTRYSSNVTTIVSAIGDGSGFVATPYVNAAGQIEDIIIEERGTGYSYLNLTVASATGSSANLFANLSVDDIDTLQTVVELSAVNGGIHAFRVSNVGNGYSYANVTVAGDGINFTGNAVIVNNTISYISVITPGSGYTNANVTITGNGANANVSAILSPYRGHGSDPVRELFADTLMFTSTINNEKNHGVDVKNDYRQFGIIKDIKQFDNERAFANVIGSGCYLVTVDTVTGLARDTVLTLTVGTDKRYFEVVEIVPSSSQILVQNKNNHVVSTSDVLTDETSDLDYTITGLTNYPSINKFSGDLLYIDNRTSVSYSEQQLVTLRTIIKL